MNETKEKALAKMLEEMAKEHSPSEDRVHNWLCEQEDDGLFQGILKDGYTIKKSLSYAKEKARKFAENGVACIDDETVFGWVREYFLANNSIKTMKQVPVDAEQQAKKSKTQPDAEPKPKKPQTTSKKKGVVEGQLDLFADLFADD